jgi:hypothetical protein
MQFGRCQGRRSLRVSYPPGFQEGARGRKICMVTLDLAGIHLQGRVMESIMQRRTGEDTVTRLYRTTELFMTGAASKPICSEDRQKEIDL